MGQPHPEIQKFVQAFENAMREDGSDGSAQRRRGGCESF